MWWSIPGVCRGSGRSIEQHSLLEVVNYSRYPEVNVFCVNFTSTHLFAIVHILKHSQKGKKCGRLSNFLKELQIGLDSRRNRHFQSSWYHWKVGKTMDFALWIYLCYPSYLYLAEEMVRYGKTHIHTYVCDSEFVYVWECVLLCVGAFKYGRIYMIGILSRY